MLDPELKANLSAAVPRKKPTIIGWIRENLAEIKAYNQQGLTYAQIAQIFAKSEHPTAKRIKYGTLKSYMSKIKKEEGSGNRPSHSVPLPKPRR